MTVSWARGECSDMGEGVGVCGGGGGVLALDCTDSSAHLVMKPETREKMSLPTLNKATTVPSR
jgi:hypothetical protein